MRSITKKGDIQKEVNLCVQAYQHNGIKGCIYALKSGLLNAKVKFPLLEFFTHEFTNQLPEKEHIQFCTEVEKLKTIGGNVLIGITLQNRLSFAFEDSIHQAALYISLADEWYVCDIIGERVFGHALLTQPKMTIPFIKKLGQHESYWVIRSTGAGMHYAVKKGLSNAHTHQIFKLILRHGRTTNRHIKQGIGWAAKTSVKFHPDIAQVYQETINSDQVGQWFRTKIRIGLERHSYAQRN